MRIAWMADYHQRDAISANCRVSANAALQQASAIR